jgi:hypothetical protein
MVSSEPEGKYRAAEASTGRRPGERIGDITVLSYMLLLAPPSPMLARNLVMRVAYPVMASKGIGTTESLLLAAEVTSYLLLPGVVNSVLMAGEIVRPREHNIAWLVSARVDALALVRTGLCVKERGGHAGAGAIAMTSASTSNQAHRLGSPGAGDSMGIPMSLPFVLLQQRGGVEAQCTAMISAGIGPSVSGHTHGAL